MSFRLTAITVCISIIFLSSAVITVSDDFYGAWTNPTGDPVGGGAGYSDIVSTGDFTVSTLEELTNALKKVKSGELVFVKNDAVITVNGVSDIVIPEGVTLASGRSGETSGAIIQTVTMNLRPLITVGGDNVRITGIRFRGPDMERRIEHFKQLWAEGGREAFYSIDNSDGIISTYSGLEVDNCELWGWSHAAIFLKKGAHEAHIHHNYIHHNQRAHLGYGVSMDQSSALIEANLFDWCRHHIAGTGRPETSYEARYNIVLPNANGHSFDMHGGRDRGDGTHIAGDTILIHHNVFMAVDVPAFMIRGVPRETAEIHHNWFFHEASGKVVLQTNKEGNMTVRDNVYGMGRVRK